MHDTYNHKRNSDVPLPQGEHQVPELSRRRRGTMPGHVHPDRKRVIFDSL